MKWAWAIWGREEAAGGLPGLVHLVGVEQARRTRPVFNREDDEDAAGMTTCEVGRGEAAAAEDHWDLDSEEDLEEDMDAFDCREEIALPADRRPAGRGWRSGGMLRSRLGSALHGV